MELLQSDLLTSLGWLEHGFGTRDFAPDPATLASLRQVHSAAVLVAESTGCQGEADALATNRAGVAVSIRTADCLPILLADPAHHAVAAVHAGWRGTAAGVAGATLERMRVEFGTEPAQVVAAIGPGIGVCCYEVGPDVAREFGRGEFEIGRGEFEIEGRVHVDLAGENRRRLIAAGVASESIDVLPLCTRCRADLFHSWRRDGAEAGRMVSFVKIINEVR